MLYNTKFYIAHHYFLIPVKSMADPTNLVEVPQEDTVFVGDRSVMFQLSKFLDDEDIVGETGITGMRAMYLVNLDKETCEKKIAQAVEARKARFDEKMKE